MAQIRQVVSESLQATIRRLLPSQQGFTEDLQASNVITPIIDLTPTAEGSALPTDFARALAFGSQTVYSVQNTTTTIINTAGFYRVFGCCSAIGETSTGSGLSNFNLSDGLTTKKIWEMTSFADSLDTTFSMDYDFVVFLNAGDSLSITSNVNARNVGSTRQVADVSGNVVNPDGFTSS